MNESIEERKKQIAEHYEIEYAPKPPKWWWAKPEKKYEHVRDVYERKGGPRHDAIETIIRNDKKGAAIGAALFLLFSIQFWIDSTTWKTGNGILSLLIIAIPVIMSLIRFFDRKPKFIVDNNGVYNHEWKGYIRWKNIAAVYIKEENNGDTSHTYLVVHFYYAETDEFYKEECSLVGLDESPDDIACFLYQFWKKYDTYSSADHYEKKPALTQYASH